MPPSWTPPFEPSAAHQEHSFARESTISRWPQIITGIIDQMSKINNQEHDDARLREGKGLIQQLAQLIYEIKHDKPLPPLPTDTGLPDDIAMYNDEITAYAAEHEGNPLTWFSATWLYAECYLCVREAAGPSSAKNSQSKLLSVRYRRIRTLFAATKHFSSFDPFATQKLDTFRSSMDGIMALARSMQQLVRKGLPTDTQAHADWITMVEICLWGNATDLSLLTSLTHEDIKALQSVERGREFLLHNDMDIAWNHVRSSKNRRFDIILDNSGFELFSDLVFADWLVMSEYASEVVFHPKNIPWFVSDVVGAQDFAKTFQVLQDPGFFTESASSDDQQALSEMVTRWHEHVDKGRFRLSVPPDFEMGQPGGEIGDFWTSPFSFTELPTRAPALLEELQKSALVIFKGDLNYRKLTSDAWWPTTTTFEEAIGPLRGQFPILSLRTCKADVCVGLEPGKAEQLDRDEPKWRVNGRYAVVSYCSGSA
ncbi:Hairy/enhancer-of-split with YRPW motif protein 2 [Microbotryomycetes sp. JL221]|nr:Hairy/enhancer-of-split with YRPW motif protein 2 [Microbotryomycetes sp. JL221]